ncbi:hypothetical protein [Vibrio vulnificus]|uniref:hypothetical protein n=1 Tax=Vibrio vulnificus TaxID=672 RepID=UPI003ED86A4F
MSVDNEKKNTQEEKNDKTKFIARSQKIGPEKNVEKSRIEPVIPVQLEDAGFNI